MATLSYSIEDLCKISGVNKGKSGTIRKRFYWIHSKYVEENDTETRWFCSQTELADKSKFKIEIIKGIDKKIPFEDICRNVQMNMEELMDEVQHDRKSSGTKLDIGYYIEDNVDEYNKTGYLRIFFDGRLRFGRRKAYRALKEDDITFEEIRLIRFEVFIWNARLINQHDQNLYHTGTQSEFSSRDPEIYGSQNLQDILDGLIQQFPRCKFNQHQSNDENQIIDAIQSLIGSEVQGLIINRWIYLYTSVSIFDALSMLKFQQWKSIFSDITALDLSRHHSLIHPLCYTRIIGMGVVVMR